MVVLQIVSAVAMVYFIAVGFISLLYSERDVDVIRYITLTLLSLITFIFVINC